MKASAQVKNSNKRTTGFIIDGNYVKYYDALQNISLIDNLDITTDGTIKSDSASLDEIAINEINQEIYNKKCEQNPLIRDVQTELEEWRTKWNDYVLYVTGARQTGKTTELLKFAYKHYEQIIYVNLANERQLKSFEELVLSNSLHFGMINYCRQERLEEFENLSSTILIIDEIQESSTVYNSIRVLQGELNCHVAVTGSYLGKTLNSQYFKPAGNMKEVEMLPLSFTEFCRAFEKEDLLYSVSLYGESEKEQYIELTDLYKIYIQIGGYPAVVKEYLRSKDVSACYEVIETIISRFTEESASYFKNDKYPIVSWLKYSKILGGCDLYNQGNVNDLLSERRFYFMDCGIVSYVAGTTPISNDTVAGILAENFVYSELYRLYKKHNLKGNKPCCSIYDNYELDFMIVDRNDRKYGIEVKSNKSNKTKSLKTYKNRALIDEAYIAEITRGGKGAEVSSIPIYTVGCRFPYN